MLLDEPKSYQEKKRVKERIAFKKTLKKRLKAVFVWTVVILMILFFGGGALISLIERPGIEERGRPRRLSVENRVKVFSDQGVAHISDGEVFADYNSNPPTSGPHYAAAAKWGIYEEELPDERLLHNLEHCGIWISYRPDIPAEEKAKIEAFARGFPSKIIVTPRAKNSSPIALAAWTRLLELDSFSEEDANGFAALYLNKIGPECSAR